MVVILRELQLFDVVDLQDVVCHQTVFVQFGHPLPVGVQKVDMQPLFKIPRMLGHIAWLHGPFGYAMHLVGSNHSIGKQLPFLANAGELATVTPCRSESFRKHRVAKQLADFPGRDVCGPDMNSAKSRNTPGDTVHGARPAPSHQRKRGKTSAYRSETPSQNGGIEYRFSSRSLRTRVVASRRSQDPIGESSRLERSGNVFAAQRRRRVPETQVV